MKKSSDLLKLSPSAIKVYESCARKYFYSYIEKLPKKEWEHLTLGSFVHAVLEQFHNELIRDPSFDHAELMTRCFSEQSARKAPSGNPSYPLKRESKIKAHEMLTTYMAVMKKSGMPNVESNERSFSIELDKNLVIRGIADRIDKDASGTKAVVDYKGLAITTPIPTPDGWTTMGDLKVGDMVIGSDGQPTTVVVKSQTHHRPCYKLTMSDKSEVVCDNVHLWNVGFRKSRSDGNYEATLDADQLFRRFTAIKEKGASGSFVIQNAKPWDLPEVDLPINPWLLGAWLGDGASKTGSFTVGRQDLEETKKLLERHWGRISVCKDGSRDVFTITCVKPDKDCCGYGHNKVEYFYKGQSEYCRSCSDFANKKKFAADLVKPQRWNVPLRTLLAKQNLLLNKHIPAQYLRASFNQRLELLRGLMDTDGHWHPIRRRCVFVSAQEQLAKSVCELLRTFGITIQTFTATDKNGFVSYRIEFRPVGFNPFSLPRKANGVDNVVGGQTHLALRRTITKMEAVDTVPTQCIAVDAPDSLYLCGEGMILTHNTGKSKYLDEFQLLVYGLMLLEDDPSLETFRGEYIVLGEGSKKIQYRFTRTDIERTREKIKKIAEQIRTDKTWEPKPSFLCNYCDFESVCPASKGLKKMGNGDAWTQTSRVD